MLVMCLTNVMVRAQCRSIRQHPMCFKIPNMQPRFITKNLAVIFIRASRIQQLPCWNSVLPRLKVGLRQRQPHRAWRRSQPRFWRYVHKATIEIGREGGGVGGGGGRAHTGGPPQPPHSGRGPQTTYRRRRLRFRSTWRRVEERVVGDQQSRGP